MNSSKLIVAYAISGVLLVTSTVLLVQSNKSKKELSNEIQTSSALTDQNKKLKKELSALHDDFNTNARNAADLIKEKEEAIKNNNEKISSLLQENKSGQTAKRKLIEIQDENSRLLMEIFTLKSQYSQLSDKSTMLQNTIAQLEDRNANLRRQYDLLKMMTSDNINLATTKGRKNKLTVVAARANQISAKLDLAGPVDNLNYIVIYPDGRKISGTESPKSTLTISGDVMKEGFDETIKSIEIKYIPKEKLKRGRYALQVYNGNDYMTGIIFNLR